MDKITRKFAKLSGLTKYFTGKPCKHGHISERNTANGCCLACVKIKKPAADKKYRAANIEIIREYDRMRSARLRNPKKLKAAKKRYYEKHKERILPKMKTYRDKNKEARATYFKNYKKENAGKVSFWNASREAAKIQRTPEWADQARIQSYYAVCAFFNEVNGYVKYHVDHIVPLKGKLVSGLHVHNNLQVIPWQDNLKKTNSWGVA